MTNNLPAWPFLPSAGVVAAISIAGLVISGLIGIWMLCDGVRMLPSYRRVKEFVGLWQFQWPLARRVVLPPEKPIVPPLVYHARMSADFSQLERGHRILLSLFCFNAADEQVLLERVSGTIDYTNFFIDEPSRVSHVEGMDLMAPLEEMSVNIEHHVPPDWVPELLKFLTEGNVLEIDLRKLRIEFKGRPSGEIAQLKTWDGVNCAISRVPIAIGRIHRVTVQESLAAIATVGA